MKRVQENGKWTLMCPSECPGLYDVYGEEFEKMYTGYEEAGKKKNNRAGVVGEDPRISN
jgi:ribonucleoside-diphosphate reductase alpha chain